MAAIVCPKCGKLTEGNASHCSQCKVVLGRSYKIEKWAKGFFGGQEMTRVILFFIVIIYLGQALVASRFVGYEESQGRTTGGAVAAIMKPDREVTYALGLQNTFAIREGGEWWRLVTSIFVHLGLLHLLFNAFALYHVGFAVESVFGSARMMLIFLGAGLTGSLASLIFGLNGAGASGALFGLIGAMVYFGWRRGGTYGREIKRKMLGWAIYAFIFGFLFNANHIAHGAGFFGGLAMAALLGWEPRGLARTRNLLALAGVILVLLAWGLTFCFYKANIEFIGQIFSR